MILSRSQNKLVHIAATEPEPTPLNTVVSSTSQETTNSRPYSTSTPNHSSRSLVTAVARKLAAVAQHARYLAQLEIAKLNIEAERKAAELEIQRKTAAMQLRAELAAIDDNGNTKSGSRSDGSNGRIRHCVLGRENNPNSHEYTTSSSSQALRNIMEFSLSAAISSPTPSPNATHIHSQDGAPATITGGEDCVARLDEALAVLENKDSEPEAYINDNLDIVKSLVTHQTDVNRDDNESCTSLYAALSAFFSGTRHVSLLLKNYADVSDRDPPLNIAESDIEVEILQEAKDEIVINCEKPQNTKPGTTTSDDKDWVANVYVEVRYPQTGGKLKNNEAAIGYNDVLKRVLEECSVEPNCKHYEGWTPLRVVTLWGQKKAAMLLLKYGTNPRHKNSVKLPSYVNNYKDLNNKYKCGLAKYVCIQVVELRIQAGIKCPRRPSKSLSLFKKGGRCGRTQTYF